MAWGPPPQRGGAPTGDGEAEGPAGPTMACESRWHCLVNIPPSTTRDTRIWSRVTVIRKSEGSVWLLAQRQSFPVGERRLKESVREAIVCGAHNCLPTGWRWSLIPFFGGRHYHQPRGGGVSSMSPKSSSKSIFPKSISIKSHKGEYCFPDHKQEEIE